MINTLAPQGRAKLPCRLNPQNGRFGKKFKEFSPPLTWENVENDP